MSAFNWWACGNRRAFRKKALCELHNVEYKPPEQNEIGQTKDATPVSRVIPLESTAQPIRIRGEQHIARSFAKHRRIARIAKPHESFPTFRELHCSLKV